MSTVQAYAEDQPCCWDYTPDTKLVKRSSPRWAMGKVKSVQQLKNQRGGPGAYYDGLVSAQKLVQPSPQRYSMPKSQRQLSGAPLSPGVGSYPGLAAAAKTLQSKSRQAIIFPYKTSRFTEDVAQSKRWVPGPGAYNIGPHS